VKTMQLFGAPVLGAMIGGGLAIAWVFSVYEDEELMAVYGLAPLGALFGAVVFARWYASRYGGGASP
jgi:hypothetical protein